MDGNQLVDKLKAKGGSGKKAKGLPKRVRNNVRKAKYARSAARLPEKKLRHVLKRNGLAAAVKYCDDGRVTLTVFRKVCQERGIHPPI